MFEEDLQKSSQLILHSTFLSYALYAFNFFSFTWYLASRDFYLVTLCFVFEMSRTLRTDPWFMHACVVAYPRNEERGSRRRRGRGNITSRLPGRRRFEKNGTRGR